MTSRTVETQTEFPPVISVVEHRFYKELGLGRGVNVTDPVMWKSKHRFMVREISPDLGNVIGTRECGKLESYKTVVGTFATQQQKLLLSLDNPYVKIGMDEHYSRSSSATKVIEGQKIETRTISFHFHFDEVPLYNTVDKVTYLAPDDFLQKCEHLSFEDNLYSWILKRIKYREDIQKYTQTEESKQTSSMKRLEEKLRSYISQEGEPAPESREIKQDCVDFIKNMGITHYVSAITLGACTYRVVTTRSEQMRVGAGASMGMNSLVEGGLSGAIAKHWFRMTNIS